MLLLALDNAGVAFNAGAEVLFRSLSRKDHSGLVLRKPLRILLASWLVIALKLSVLPEGVWSGSSSGTWADSIS